MHKANQERALRVGKYGKESSSSLWKPLADFHSIFRSSIQRQEIICNVSYEYAAPHRKFVLRYNYVYKFTNELDSVRNPSVTKDAGYTLLSISSRFQQSRRYANTNTADELSYTLKEKTCYCTLACFTAVQPLCVVKNFEFF